MTAPLNKDELREKLAEKIYHWIYVQAHPEYTATKMSRKSERFADQILALLNSQIIEAERRGEVYQLKMLQHWQNLHNIHIEPADIRHFLRSLEQFPNQPLARESLATLESEEQSNE